MILIRKLFDRERELLPFMGSIRADWILESRMIESVFSAT